MNNEKIFSQSFNKLKGILEEYESQMDLKVNSEYQYSLDTFKINPINKKITFFVMLPVVKTQNERK
ncbi:hypothetical protein [Cohnella luojiensis]|uniref:Uncharacterized protein n=1 Tax=Cohnella luojiensis TaxID=652876 RepID=A0A4Y8LTG4_9BACL|nr:hypothetical protein [Cohnella luojiensis]TFE19078.1 hypothetical protein E2980_23790 [Cohnella luojiensis]